ncbi:NAD(P)/FAD-dependent oxidoreductase, partial [Cribrihabitans sp. XS_ASV171]
SPTRHHELAQTHSKLTSRATLDHAPWIAAAKADHLIQRSGFLHAFSDSTAFRSAGVRAERLLQEYGVRFAVLDGSALKKLEPGLRKTMAGAIHWLDPWTCHDPGALVASYADLFRSRGGQLLFGDAMTLAQGAGTWHVKTSDGSKAHARQVVIAMGMRSAELSSRLGLRVPLFPKRGYHLHLRVQHGPVRPFVDVASSAVLAPMSNGLRLLTGAEIARAGAITRPIQLERAKKAAEDLFDVGEPLDKEPWIGVRPCMPDMLPVLGALPGHEGLWANFGHGHQGFTLGPTTAHMLAAEMTGGAPIPRALSPSRKF